MHVYLEQGETVYLGTSVANAKLYNTNNGVNSGYLFSNSAMGTSYTDAQLAYVNTADVYVTQGNYANIAAAIGDGKTPGKNGVTLVDLAANATDTTPGYIYDSVQEAGGVDIAGTGTGYKVTDQNTISTSTSGYVAGTKTNANTFTASAGGVYTVVFFSSAHTMENPAVKLASDITPFAQTQKGGTVASWDISVYHNGALQTGRVFTSMLFLNMGGNVLSGGVSKGALYSDVYAVTNDGYQYKVDFNGMDPYGFVFFANNRGLLKVDGTDSSSLYHGVRSENNTLSDMTSHGINLNATPYNTNLDQTYNLFYEAPASAALTALGIEDPSSGKGGIKDFKFSGNDDATDNQGYVGKGGTFSFLATSDISATSYEIDLDFSSTGGGTVVLSNSIVKGVTNSISWDGKDANGDIVPAGTYKTLNASLKLKGGEVHFPLLDVEQNRNGIKITRLNGTDPDSMVYFNNSSSNAGSVASPWTIAKNWQVGNEIDATTGVDSSNGAMAFTNVHSANSAKGKKLLGDGDQCALDVWAYYNRSVSLDSWSFKLVDTSFTVTKTWDNIDGTPAAGNPSVQMTLYDSDGNQVSTDAVGKAIANPVTVSEDSKDAKGKAWAYTWSHLDPSKTYYVTEKTLTGYTTTNSGSKAAVTGNVADGYAQAVTNAYKHATLKLTKAWNMNGSKETHPASVTLSVYTAKDQGGTHIGDYPLSDANSWTTTINPIDSTLTYYVYETAVDGYTTLGDFKAAYTITGEGKTSGNGNDGFQSTITNTFDSGKFMSVEVFKLWTDGDAYAVYQPASIKVGLYKDGALVTKDAAGEAITNPATLSASNGWYCIWPALVAQDTSDKGYTIKETDPDGNALLGYAATTDSPNFLHNFGYGGFENAYKTTSFTVNKSWDNGISTNQPTSVSMQLWQSTDGGATYAQYGAAQTLNADNDWAYKWTDLPTYTSGNKQILYKAAETAVDNYTTTYGEVTGDVAGGYAQTIANTYDCTQLTITKTWDRGAQAEADWPASATFQILADGGVTGDSVILTSDDAAGDGSTWTKVVSDLPKYDSDGIPIKYAVQEVDVTGYTQSGGEVTGDAASGFAVSFTNTLQSVDIPVAKTWDHGNQAQADWPTSATVHLLANGTEVAKATLTAADSWTHTFSDEPRYDTAGDAITYAVTEDAASDYTTTVSGSAAAGFTVANAYNLATLKVTKVWSHGAQAQADWPASVTFNLLKDGTVVATQKLTAANGDSDGNWSYTWTGLEKSATYTVTEDAVANYKATGGTVNGTAAAGWTALFTNTYDPGTTPTSTGTDTGTTTATDDSSDGDSYSQASTARTGDGIAPIAGLLAGLCSAAFAAAATARRRV